MRMIITPCLCGSVYLCTLVSAAELGYIKKGDLRDKFLIPAKSEVKLQLTVVGPAFSLCFFGSVVYPLAYLYVISSPSV